MSLIQWINSKQDSCKAHVHGMISLEREEKNTPQIKPSRRGEKYTSNQTFQVADTANVGLKLHTHIGLLRLWVAKVPHTQWVAKVPHTVGC